MKVFIRLVITLASSYTVQSKRNGEGFVNPKRVDHADIDTTIRPVVGILTEPMRGEVLNKADNAVGSDQQLTYIPKPHVQFLEQAGVRVVPIDFRLPTEQRWALYEQLNGVYMPGDSHMGVVNELYRAAFADTLIYQEQQMNEKKEHFPLFLMGNSLTNLVRAKQSSGFHLSDIKPMLHQSFEVQLLAEPKKSYLFSHMTSDEEQAVFNRAKLFNKEVSGLRIEYLNSDAALYKKYKPLAVFKNGDTDDERVVAIIEGINVPLYAFTYGIELIQFYFENSTENLDEHELDHTIVARTHAQYIASLFADEARLSTHRFEDSEQIFERLARHLPVATVRYSSDDLYRGARMPSGMRQSELYLLQ